MDTWEGQKLDEDIEYFEFDFNKEYFDKVFDDPKKEDLKEADLKLDLC